MATLNTLRTRGGVIVSIVIGIALLAFLLGDFVPRGCTETNVGIINGHKVSYVEYANQAELYNVIFQSLNGREALSSEEQDMARNMAWESLVVQYSYQPGLEKLGLWTSKAEEIDMVSGVHLSPVITQMFFNPETGQYDPAMLQYFVSNIDVDPTGRMGVMWNYFQEQMSTQRAMSKFITLVTKGMYVNDLEVEAGVQNANMSYDARVAQRLYSSIPDSLVRLTNSDLKDYYNKHKRRFKQQASREIEYVMFDLLPSDQDYLDAEKYIGEIYDEFAASETPFQYAMLNSQTTPDNRFLKEAQVDRAIAATVFNNPDAIYGPVLSGDIYTIARQSDYKLLPDSVGAKHILLPAGSQESADSIVMALRRGANFAQLSEVYSLDDVAARNGGDLGVFTPEQMIPAFSDALIAHNRGDVFTVTTDFGIHVVEMTYKSPLSPKAQIATIKYRVEPSSYTQQEVYAEASSFLTDASGSYDNFRKAATESALTKRVARIRNTDRNVTGIDDSRELVRWAFTNRKGDVSDILELGGNYVVASLTSVREEGIASLEDVVDVVRPEVVRQKKADMIFSELKGASIEQAAGETGVKEVNDLNFSTFYVDGVGMEQQLVGAITANPGQGVVSKPVKGEMGVYMFIVDNITNSEETTLESERVRQDATSTAYLSERLGQALNETAKVTDSRVRFF